MSLVLQGEIRIEQAVDREERGKEEGGGRRSYEGKHSPTWPRENELWEAIESLQALPPSKLVLGCSE